MTIEDSNFFNELLGDSINEGFGKEYNIFCCEQAVVIAESLKTKEKIAEFFKLNYDIQKEMVPLLSDDHSGNTFGMSCKLAIAYLPMLRDKKIDEIIKK